MIALIDNFDSFTYNVYQLLRQITDIPVEVYRNNEITVDALAEKKPEYLIISPGPGRPDEAGISIEAIKYFAGKIPILGICLGHQSIGEAFGAEIVQAKEIVHGKIHKIQHDNHGVFRGLKQDTTFTRYHSLAIKEETLSDDFVVTARAEDGEIMGVRHKSMIIEGVQFHPESIGSAEGERMMKNFLHYKKDPIDRHLILNTLVSGQDLSRKLAADFMDELTDGNLSEVYIASVLAAITAKGVTAEEIAGCVEVLHAKKKPVKLSIPVMDVCGTGGDGLSTFNISSFSALIAAACGAKIAKHGNRAVSSKSGSSQFYEELGINLDLKPEQTVEMIEKEGFAFLFAPYHHKSMRFAAPVRRQMGVKTIMNMLGPLANPADASYQLIGVFDDSLCPKMAAAAKMIGLKRVLVVHSQDGMDELSIAAPSRTYFIDEAGTVTDSLLDPADLGITGYTLDDLAGGTAKENAEIALEMLNGGGSPAIKEACCLNAGAALFVHNLAPSIEEGYAKAKEALASGAVKTKLDTIIKMSREG